jgi:RecB family exonuclease
VQHENTDLIQSAFFNDFNDIADEVAQRDTGGLAAGMRIVILPTERLRQKLEWHLTRCEAALLPRLTTVKELLGNNILAIEITAELKARSPRKPIPICYQLSKKLCDLLGKLILYNIPHEDAMLPTRDPYEDNLTNTVNYVLSSPRIKKCISINKKKIDTLLANASTVLFVGEEGDDGVPPMLRGQRNILYMEKSGESRATQNVNGEVEFLEFSSLSEEGYGIIQAVRRAIKDNKSVLIVAPNSKLREIIRSGLRCYGVSNGGSGSNLYLKTHCGLKIQAVLDVLKEDFTVNSVLKALRISSHFTSHSIRLESFWRRKDSTPPFFLATQIQNPSTDPEIRILAKKIEEFRTGAFAPRTFQAWIETCCELYSIFHLECSKELYGISSKFLRPPFAAIEMTMGEFDVFFRAHILSRPTQAEKGSDNHRVEILDAEEAQFLEADQIIVGDVNEESWVKSFEKNDLWMTQNILHHFGMPSIKKKNEALRNIFKSLIYKKNVLLTRSRLVDGNKQQRYKYFDKIADNLIIKEARWLKELLKVNVSRKAGAEMCGNPNPPLNLRPRRFEVSDIDLLIHDPYAFYAKRILKLPETTLITEFKNIRGNYIHEVLEKFIKNPENIRTLAKLQEVAHDTLKIRGLGPAELGLWFFRMGKIFSFVIDNLTAQKHYAEIAGSCIINIEENYEIQISCKADRIDENEQSEISIIDYKSSDTPTRSQVQRGDKMQLALEAIIAEHDGFRLKKTKVKSCCYWDLKNLEIQHVTPDNKEVLLKNLIRRYNIIGEAYKANAHSHYKAYLHLARVKEFE